jgi:hypothetical protein
MRRNAGLTLFELIVVIVLCALVLLFLPVLSRDDHVNAKCKSHLKQIGTALSLYMNTHGGTTYFPVPAQAFRGDCWLATLYWTGIITEPEVFLCPASGDHGKLPPKRPADLSSADAIPPDAISYAGRCYGLTGELAHRNARGFTCPTGMFGAIPVASDDNEGYDNHKDGINVGYGDSHVEFFPSADGSIYDQIGKRGADSAEPKMLDRMYNENPAALSRLDSGESPLEMHRPHGQPPAPPWAATTRIILVVILVAAAIIFRRPLRTLIGLPACGPSTQSGGNGEMENGRERRER